ncbi:MAG: FtsQ-type POTRA domain-containing protein [Peptococcaceae bacterium]|nr:FtsQ-type POTRA domain-containing protein [Peptococcaceae bacterium]
MLVLITGYVLLRSPFFEVSRILVRGNQFLSEDTIKSAAGINTGENIFKLDLAAAASGLKVIPLVRDVRIERSFPSTVVITVQERVPLALLPTGDGFIEVDGEGVCLQKAGAGIPGLPVITGVQGDIPNPGQVVRAGRLEEALAVVGGLPGEVVAALSEVHVGEDGLLSLYTIDGIQCRFGAAADIREKGEVLAQLLMELRRQKAKVRYIDLSSAGQPVVLFKN